MKKKKKNYYYDDDDNDDVDGIVMMESNEILFKKNNTTEGGKKTLLYVELCVFDTGIIKLRTFSLYPQINIYTKPDLKHSSLTHSLSRSQAANQTNTYIQRNGTERNEMKSTPIHTFHDGDPCTLCTPEREQIGILSEASE